MPRAHGPGGAGSRAKRPRATTNVGASVCARARPPRTRRPGAFIRSRHASVGSETPECAAQRARVSLAHVTDAPAESQSLRALPHGCCDWWFDDNKSSREVKSKVRLLFGYTRNGAPHRCATAP